MAPPPPLRSRSDPAGCGSRRRRRSCCKRVPVVVESGLIFGGMSAAFAAADVVAVAVVAEGVGVGEEELRRRQPEAKGSVGPERCLLLLVAALPAAEVEAWPFPGKEQWHISFFASYLY